MSFDVIFILNVIRLRLRVDTSFPCDIFTLFLIFIPIRHVLKNR